MLIIIPQLTQRCARKFEVIEPILHHSIDLLAD
jgi:hypothetical protein